MPPLLLLWNDDNTDFRAALTGAGLESRFRIQEVKRAERPDTEALAEAEAMLAWGAPPGMLQSMPRLRWLQAPTAGVDHWLGRPDLRADIMLCCARGTHRGHMAENILGSIFHALKPYRHAVLAQPHARWERHAPVRLAGLTLGILGLGAVGGELAALASAIGMRVVGMRNNPAPMPGVDEVHGPDGVDAVLAQSDVVVLLLPSTPATENLMNAERLARMKPSAWLVNFGRGSLIEDAALIAALEQGVIAGALLDVFREEPLPAAHPFWTTRNLLVLPHLGGMHPRRNAQVAALLAENARRFLDGEALREMVDRARGY